MVITFKPGDIVWAKLKGYRWWPAKIQNETNVSDILRNSKPKKKFSVIPIYFYGSKDYAWIGYDSILSFSDNYHRLSSDPSKPQLFKKSLDDAELDLSATIANTKKLTPTVKKPHKIQKLSQVETKKILNKKRGRPSKNSEQYSSPPTNSLVENYKQGTLDTTGAHYKEAPSAILEKPEVPITSINSEFLSVNNESDSPVKSKIFCGELLRPTILVSHDIDFNNSFRSPNELTDRDTPRKRGRPIKSSSESVKRRGRASKAKKSASDSSKMNLDNKLTFDHMSFESEEKLTLDDTEQKSPTTPMYTVPDSLTSADLKKNVVPNTDLHLSKKDSLAYNVSENTGASDAGLSLSNSGTLTSAISENTVTPFVDFSLGDRDSLKNQLVLNCSDLSHSKVGKATECESQEAQEKITKYEAPPINSEDLILSTPPNKNQDIVPLITPPQDFVSPSIDNLTSVGCTPPTIKSKKEFVASTCLRVSRHLSEMHRLRHYLQKYTVVENMENRPEIEAILTQLEIGTPDIEELRTSSIVKLLRHLVKKDVIDSDDEFYSRCKGLVKKFRKLLNDDCKNNYLGSWNPNDTSRHSKKIV